jgi:hypothetical protein
MRFVNPASKSKYFTTILVGNTNSLLTYNKKTKTFSVEASTLEANNIAGKYSSNGIWKFIHIKNVKTKKWVRYMCSPSDVCVEDGEIKYWEFRPESGFDFALGTKLIIWND